MSAKIKGFFSTTSAGASQEKSSPAPTQKAPDSYSPPTGLPPLSSTASMQPRPTPLATPPDPPKTETFVLSEPSTRISVSPSPASSPRIVEPDAHVSRTRSLKPKMSSAAASPPKAGMHSGSANASASALDCMDGGIDPGADFFEDCSTSSEGEDDEDEERRRSRGEKGKSKEIQTAMEDDDDDAWESSSSASSISPPGPSTVNTGLGIDLDPKKSKSANNTDSLLRKWRHDASRQGQVLHRADDSSTADVDMYADEDEEEDGLSEEEERKGRAPTRLPPIEISPENKDNPSGNGKPRQARQMSLRRLAPGSREGVRVVHNHGSLSPSGSVSVPRTPRVSLVIPGNAPDDGHGHHRNYSLPSPMSFVSLRGGAELPSQEKSTAVKTRRRRGTNDSLKAVLQTHAITMRALESLSPTASYPPVSHLSGRPRSAGAALGTAPEQPWSPSTRGRSLTASRHIHIAPVLPTRARHRPHSRGRPSDELTRYEYDGPSKSDDDEYTDMEDGYEDHVNPNSPAHLPSHFVRTPYPFMPKKEFPRPNPRPRHYSFDGDASDGDQQRLVPRGRGSGSGTGADEYYSDQQFKGRQVVGLVPSANDKRSVKGKQVLGLKPGDKTAGRTLKRAQSEKTRRGGIQAIEGGVGRGRRAAGGSGPLSPIPHSGKAEGANVMPGFGKTHQGVEVKELGAGTKNDASNQVVYISLRHRRREDGVSKRLERIEIPGNLTTTTPTHSPKRADGARDEKAPHAAGKAGPQTKTQDFDDAFFAEQLHLAYRRLAGSWFRRTFSARKLGCIRLARVDIWSGGSLPSASRTRDHDSTISTASPTGLLTAVRVPNSSDTYRDDSNVFDIDASNPFTEAKLWDLWRHPQQGKGRYAWVHWARRIADVNSGLPDIAKVDNGEAGIDIDGISEERGSSSHAHRHRVSSSAPSPRTSVLTIQFTHTFSILRLCLALSLILAVTVASALLWIFLGTSGWRDLQAGGKAERVGPGMLIAVAALLVQMIGFAIWVGVSWWVVP